MRLSRARNGIGVLRDGLGPRPGCGSQRLGLASIALRPCANGSEIKLWLEGLRSRTADGRKACENRKYRKVEGPYHSAQQFRLRQTR